MKNSIKTVRSGRLVSFDQGSAFFRRRAFISQEKGQFLDALNFLRKACEKEPDNIDALLDLAQLYTQMDCFDESNRLIFRLLADKDFPKECFFAMGLNFYGLMEYDKAQEGFLAYLLAEPDGEYALDCEDMLENLELDEETSSATWQLAMRGKAALDSGDVERAERLLQRAVDQDPELPFARNNLSLALFFGGHVDAALRHAEIALRQYSDDVYTLSNMAVFLADKNENDPRIVELFARAEAFLGDDPDYMHKLALTACALHWHEKAYSLLGRLIQIKPYDVEILFYAAVACVHLSLFQQAEKHLLRASRVAPDNSVIEYYIAELRRGNYSDMRYRMQVPEREMLRRMRYLNDIVRSGKQVAAYREDPDFKRFMWWGLELPDMVFKRAIVNISSMLASEDAQRILKDLITRREENDELKREAMGLLKQIGAPEPYLAYIDRQIVEVQVSVLEAKAHIPVSYERIAREVADRLREEKQYAAVDHARRVWLSYINALGEDIKPIRAPKGWCAALMYIALKKAGEEADTWELAMEWSSREGTVLRCVQEILDATEEKLP